MSKRRSRGLTPEDLAVWQAAARSMRPLKPTKPLEQPTDGAPAPINGKPVTPPKPPPVPEFRIGQKLPPTRSGFVVKPNVAERLSTMPLAMDAKTHKRMTRGKLKPEAKLDLHGMTLAQAHPVLVGFVHRAYRDGMRLVLVVTGKGKDRDDGGPIPTPKGLLKHHVPGWLQAPALRPMVLQITDAHIRHGGGGAYYIYLRRGG